MTTAAPLVTANPRTHCGRVLPLAVASLWHVAVVLRLDVSFLPLVMCLWERRSGLLGLYVGYSPAPSYDAAMSERRETAHHHGQVQLTFAGHTPSC